MKLGDERTKFQPRPGEGLGGGANRPLRTFSDEENKVGCSIWPSREDPEQPKFKIDCRYRRSDGVWVDKKYLYYREALSVMRVLYAAIKWACKEAGEPVPSLDLIDDSEQPARREFREPGEMRSEQARRTGVRGEDYNSRPGRYEDDDDSTPF